MFLGGAFKDPEGSRRVLVGVAHGDEPQDFGLALGEAQGAQSERLMPRPASPVTAAWASALR